MDRNPFLIIRETLGADWSQQAGSFFKSIPMSTYLSFFAILMGSVLSYSYYGIASTLDQEALGAIDSRMEKMSVAFVGSARPVLWFVSSRVMSGSYMPYLNILLASALLSLAAFLYSGIYCKGGLERLLPGLLLATFPLFSASLPLHQWNVAFGLSYLTACGALYQVVANGRWAIAATLLFFTLANYQSSIGFFSAGVLARLLFIFSVREDFAEVYSLIKNAALALFFGALAYAPIFIWLSSSGASEYAAAQTQLVSSASAVWSNLERVFTLNFFRAIGSGFYKDGFSFAFISLFSLHAVVAAYHVIAHFGKYAVLVLPVLVFAWCLMIVAATPIELLLEGRFLWARASVALAVPITLASAVLINQNYSHLFKNISFLLSIVLIFTFVQQHNTNAFSQQVTNTHNLSLGIRIADRIEQLPSFDESKSYRIVAADAKRQAVHASGARNYRPLLVTNVYGGQRFTWYIENHFRILGLNNVTHHRDPSRFLEIRRDFVEGMPKWPAKNSVQITDGDVIVIRF